MQSVEFVIKVSFGDTCRTKDGRVHGVKHLTVPETWELGAWRMLETFCNQYLRHHPKKRDRRYNRGETLDCLACIAAGAKP